VKVERATDIAASPEEVYEVVMDPRRLEDWVTIHHHLEDAPDGELKEGSELTQCLKLAGQKFKVRWRVVEDDCPRRVVWEGRGPVRSKARVMYELEPNGEGTHFSYTNQYELPGGVLGRLAGRSVSKITTKETDATLEKLKQLIE
jgi:carbon monoxide dehydrogenase subunit G